MTYFKYTLLAIAAISLLVFSCEKDDICAEATSTTPRVIITFYDVNNPDDLKEVDALSIQGIDADGTVLEELVEDSTTSLLYATLDSIALPLNFNEEGITAASRFRITKNTDYDSDEDDTTSSNSDVIEITYTPEFIYVSRACGYKAIFEGTEVDRIEQDDDDLWIINVTTENTTIENEDEAHIYIYH